jgi:predicted NBD/HSP70 family sugar kinase
VTTLQLGLDVQDARCVAVALDSGGEVLGRASAESVDGLPAAARTAVGRVAIESAASGALGIACFSPESASAAEVLASIGRDFPTLQALNGLAHSGTAAAVAEAWVGAGQGARDVVYFAVSEHTTAGLVRDGAPVTGARGRAASVAWLALNPVEREDYRKTGCLEAETAAVGIVRRLIWRIKAGDRSRIQDTVGDDLTAITVDHILDAARQRDGVSISVVRDTAKYVGMAAANLVAIADPEMLVLGGILATAADLLLEPVRTEIARRLPRQMTEALTIVPAALGAEAAAIGAARLAAPRR